jgi:hypothetical protein
MHGRSYNAKAQIVLVAILSSFSSYWIFHRWLEVVLPSGIIGIG